MKTFYVFLMLLCAVVSATAQDASMDTAEQRRVIDSLCTVMNSDYVFQDVALKVTEKLQSNVVSGAYSSLKDPAAFARKLTDDVADIAHDKHLRIRFAPAMNAEMREMNALPEEEQGIPESYLNEMRRNNYGFRKVSMLPGNIGYLDLTGFNPASFGGETAAAAMTFLANSEALIIDLRENGGGSPGMIQLITTYLYDQDSDPVHLNNFYFRPTDEHTQTWTLPYVPGKRLGSKKPVYVLTSSNTFSAAEEFTYNLKNLKRATIVGETTGGGAHPGGQVPVAERFVAFIPSGRAINPITNTNWEGTGVTPDVPVDSKEALDKACALALDNLATTAKNEEDARFYKWHQQIAKSKIQPTVLTVKEMEAFVGTYGPRKIFIEHGNLCYQREGGAKHILSAMDKDLFCPATMTDFRIQFEREDGKIVALTGLYQDGRAERNERSKNP